MYVVVVTGVHTYIYVNVSVIVSCMCVSVCVVMFSVDAIVCVSSYCIHCVVHDENVDCVVYCCLVVLVVCFDYATVIYNIFGVDIIDDVVVVVADVVGVVCVDVVFGCAFVSDIIYVCADVISAAVCRVRTVFMHMIWLMLVSLILLMIVLLLSLFVFMLMIILLVACLLLPFFTFYIVFGAGVGVCCADVVVV